MKIGAEKVAALLADKKFAELTEAQKKRIIHLVSMHDKTEQAKDIDERVLIEADTLGAIDFSRTKPTFSRESNTEYMTKARQKRLPLFVTDFGRRQFEKLAILREEYYAKQKY